MRGKYYIALLVTAFFVQNVQSQFEHFYENWRWSHFTTSSGLPSDVVESIIETENNIPWVSTAKGLAWYDGYHWNPIPVDSSKPFQRVRSISRHVKDMIFVILDGSLYLGNEKGFIKIRFFALNEPGVVSTVASLDSASFLCTYETNDSAYVLKVQNGMTEKLQCLPPGKLHRTVHTVWYAPGVNAGIFEYRNGTWSKIFRPLSEAFVMRSIVENDEGKGIIALDAPKNKIGIWEYQDKKNITYVHSERNQPVRTVGVSNSGDAVVVYESGEIHTRHNKRWGKLDPVPLQMVSIISLCYRSNNDIWFTTEKGLYLFKDGQNEWSKNKYTFSDVRNVVMEIFTSSEGDVWVGNMDGLEIIRPNGSSQYIRSILNVPLGLVTGINQDTEGHIWVCAGGGAKGLFEWDGKRWHHYFGTLINFQKIRKDQKGNLWFLGLGKKQSDPAGYFRRNSRFHRIDSMIALPSNRLYSFAESRNGTIWIGSSQGLTRYRHNKVTQWGHESIGRNAKVFTMAVDSNEHIWFSTFSSYLATLSPNDSIQWIWKKEEQHEYNDKLWDLTFDDTGVLWVASSRGIFRYFNDTWSNFGSKTGAVIKELRVVVPTKERILVGGHGIGVRSIARQNNMYPLHIHVSKPIVDNSEAYCSWSPTSYWSNSPSDEIETRYRLNNEEWSHWAVQNNILLKHLKSGQHVISVQAKDSNGRIYDADSTELFEIEPIILYRPIFYVPIILLWLIIIGLIIRSYQERKQHLRNMENQRIRISNDLHDDVGSNLGSISLISQRLGRNKSVVGRVKKDLSIISDTAIQTAEELRDIVWYITPKNDITFSMTVRLREIALRQLPGLELHYTVSDSVKNDIGLMRVRRNLLLMYKEILHNIVKHSNAKKVTVLVDHQPGIFRLTVSDNGVGFDHRQNFPGNGMNSLKLRADEINGHLKIDSIKNVGTTITLVLENYMEL